MKIKDDDLKSSNYSITFWGEGDGEYRVMVTGKNSGELIINVVTSRLDETMKAVKSFIDYLEKKENMEIKKSRVMKRNFNRERLEQDYE